MTSPMYQMSMSAQKIMEIAHKHAPMQMEATVAPV